MVKASIIVCTRNRAEMLADCLGSLLADNSVVKREIIVVDNGSTDNTPQKVIALQQSDQPVPIELLGESKVGLSNARNAGVARAGGTVLLFIDDDMLVEDGWADRLAAGVGEHCVVAACGRVMARWPYPPPDWMSGDQITFLTSPDYGDEARPLAESEHLTGGNMAISSAALRSVEQPFDPSFGHSGDMHMGGEDVLLSERLLQEGRLEYRANAIAHHRIPAERMSRDWLRRRYFQGGVGLARMERMNGLPEPSLSRRIVRTLRACRGARATRHRNDRAVQLTAEAAQEELLGYMWAGMHLDMLFRRFSRLTDRIVRQGL